MQNSIILVLILLSAALTQPQEKQALAETRQYEKDAERLASVPSGQTKELCVELPVGLEKQIGPYKYRDWYHRPSVVAYAKKPSASGWGKPCRQTAEDLTVCDDSNGSGFLGSTFELETVTPYSQNICWSFINRSKELMSAKITVHYLLNEGITFVIGYHDPNNHSPLLVSAVSSCFCLGKDGSVTAYFGSMLGPRVRFYAQRGDIVEIRAAGEGKKNGIPAHCDNELASGSYHVKIEHVRAFEQPAVYKTFIIGRLTSEPLTDKRALVNDYLKGRTLPI
jgi:hypothetical protein